MLLAPVFRECLSLANSDLVEIFLLSSIRLIFLQGASITRLACSLCMC